MPAKPEIDMAETHHRLEECFGSRAAVIAHMLVSLSCSGQPTDVTFYQRRPIFNVRVDDGLAAVVLRGMNAQGFADLLNNRIEFSDGTIVGLSEIWTVNPMPLGGISQAEMCRPMSQGFALSPRRRSSPRAARYRSSSARGWCLISTITGAVSAGRVSVGLRLKILAVQDRNATLNDAGLPDEELFRANVDEITPLLKGAEELGVDYNSRHQVPAD